ncbi:hypothetical protein ACL02U_10550 [Streptomyces sp. MS06]|uniref:hypothetical protein n=1 Tax=Streptomyces sp. MS06 TaxID=3385974 RepID=UPI0039A3F26A
MHGFSKSEGTIHSPLDLLCGHDNSGVSLFAWVARTHEFPPQEGELVSLVKRTATRTAAVAPGASAALGGLAVAPASAASIPSCVSYSVSSGWVTTTAKVTNNCTHSIRVRFNWAYHVDGPCTTIGGYGGWRKETVAATASFQGVYYC